VMFGDTLYDYDEKSPVEQVIDTYQKYGGPVVGLSEVDNAKVGKFGVIDGVNIGADIYEIKKFVEKPKPEEAPSNLAAVGVYVITPEVFRILGTMKAGKSGEIRLADAFDLMLANNKVLFGKKLAGEWLDTGDKLNFIKATLTLGLKNAEIGADLRDYLKKLGERMG